MHIIYRLRGWLMVPPMVFVTFCTWREVENHLVAFGGGGLVFAAGVALRVWAQMHLHYRLKAKKVLTTTGPYRYVRNPIYIANTIILVGACMLTELFWFVPIQLAYCAGVYSLVVRHEEAHLGRKYGIAYREYVAQVPRWLPALGRLGRDEVAMWGYFGPSLLAESHNLLFLVPAILKELIVR